MTKLTNVLNAMLTFAEQYERGCLPINPQARRSEDQTLEKTAAAARAVTAITQQLEAIGQLSSEGIDKAAHAATTAQYGKISVIRVVEGYSVELKGSPLGHRELVWSWVEGLARALEKQLNEHLPEAAPCCLSELYIYEWAEQKHTREFPDSPEERRRSHASRAVARPKSRNRLCATNASN